MKGWKITFNGEDKDKDKVKTKWTYYDYNSYSIGNLYQDYVNEAKEINYSNYKTYVRSSHKCSHCGEELVYFGFNQTELLTEHLRVSEEHKKKCKVRIREKRIDKLLKDQNNEKGDIHT
jgi:hypothetical protein